MIDRQIVIAPGFSKTNGIANTYLEFENPNAICHTTYFFYMYNMYLHLPTISYHLRYFTKFSKSSAQYISCNLRTQITDKDMVVP